jgi:HSP20 family protein
LEKGGVIMPGLIIWKNQHMNRLKRDIDTMFDRVWGEYGITSAHHAIRRMPSFELTDTGPALLLIGVMPDIDPDDMELSITGDLITLKGKIHRDIIKEGNNFYRTFDSFTRTIKIHCPVETAEVEAVYENGILKVILPKAPQEKIIIKIKKITR